jgi:hypothetical protein
MRLHHLFGSSDRLSYPDRYHYRTIYGREPRWWYSPLRFAVLRASQTYVDLPRLLLLGYA